MAKSKLYSPTSLQSRRKFFVFPSMVSLAVLVSIGIICVLCAFVLSISMAQGQDAVEQSLAQYQLDPTTFSLPARIHIDSLIDTAIEPTTVAPPYWGISKQAASYLLDSARLGTPGNVVIYGHNSGRIFRNLSKVKVGSTVTLTDGQKELYTYTVTEIKEVTANDVSILEPTSEPTLTLFTCSGVFDTKRLVVRATLQI